MVTQKDVAKLAGVSISTVSRVLNGSSLVDGETKKNVESAIKKLNYKPNLVAYGLRAKSSKLIGLILPELVHQAYSMIAQYVETRASDKGYSMILGVHRNDPECEKWLIDDFQRRNVDGIILQPVHDEPHTSANLKEYTRVPMVLYGQSFSSDQMGTVQLDNYKAGIMAAEHFVKLGHRHIACTAGPINMEYLRERLNGFRDGLTKHNIVISQQDICACELNYQVPGVVSGQRAVMQFLDGRDRKDYPTAIWAHNDLVAVGIIKELHQRKIRVPEDVSVIGMDNMVLTDMIYPPLTTIGQPLEQMATMSVDILLKEIELKEQYAPENIRMEPQLIIRQSTGKYSENVI